ncbi:hypothetical protein G6F57_017310 [Rhizopus arrhizus]|nr:hypothetical protein G6F57_017310 [Rhizopus arrhizus]
MLAIEGRRGVLRHGGGRRRRFVYRLHAEQRDVPAGGLRAGLGKHMCGTVRAMARGVHFLYSMAAIKAGDASRRSAPEAAPLPRLPDCRHQRLHRGFGRTQIRVEARHRQVGHAVIARQGAQALAQLAARNRSHGKSRQRGG